MYRVYKNFLVFNIKHKKIKCGFKRKYCSENVHNLSNTDLDTAYNPEKIDSIELLPNYFHSKDKKNERFSLVLPPPNITGTLHLGHSLTCAIQDVIIRWKQMQGVDTIWVPGIDHAGIATQVIVEKRLWKEKRQTRHHIGRENFQKEVYKWKEEKARVIGEQMRRLNLSINWEREVFTLDKIRSRAVSEAFIKLFNSGLIYRNDQLVNWSCVLLSAISDIEVEQINIDGPTNIPVPGYEKPIPFGTLFHFAYKLHNSDDEVIVATTRPETMCGDVAVAVNPQDDRYSRFVGRYLWHPFRKETIPIIADHFVDPSFGSGAVKITPAHSTIDFEVGKRHNLPNLNVINERGELTDICGQFKGLKRFDARNIIISELTKLQLLRKTENHKMIIPICSRSKDVVEFLLKPQWFLKCDRMAYKAIDDVKTGRLTIEPKQFENTWFHWLENIRDWCISRQLWWGHQIPIYSCSVNNNSEENIWIAAENASNAAHDAAKKFSVHPNEISTKQDEDVLDTWFSSALQPFSVFGWPDKSEDFNKYYPLDLMETGHDIVFFWVARMVMLGNELTRQLPFNKILLHGIICDAQGRKMSKSLGNVVAPEDVITGCSLQKLGEGSKTNYATGILSKEELKRAIQNQKKMFPQGIPECGSDSLRFTLLSHNVKNHFINFDVNECHTNRLFCNKIWQATRFTKLWFNNVSKENSLPIIPYENLLPMDKWILSRLSYMVESVNNNLEKYDFHFATEALKNFLYYDFCDNYLESTKRGLKIPQSETAAGHCWTLLTCLDVGFRVLSPFMPALTQHLHQHLPLYPNNEKQYNFPQELPWRNKMLENDIELILETVVGIRRLKKMFNITAKHKPEVHIASNIPFYADFIDLMEDLTASYKVTSSTVPPENLIRNMVQDNVRGNATIYLVVPDELMRAIELDLDQMEKKRKKLLVELDRMTKMVSGGTYKINVSEDAQIAHSKKIAVLEEKIKRIDYMTSLFK